ncbi:MAG: formylmethanofuran dehydrogenase subunit E family protein [Deltaproteobacteria bacterium]|nr:formylmethanofuran dehydrogenase subunit E family protein [Deltaproteobacteria bacterium]
MKTSSLLSLWVAPFLLLPALTAAAPDAGVFDALHRFHGHRCGGSILGARLGAAARSALGDEVSKGKVRAVYYATGCPLDGIQVTTGSTLGNGTIEVKDRKEMRLRLSVEGVRGAVEARPTELALALGSESKVLTKKAKGLPQGSPERAELEARVAEIFARLETAPDGEVVLTTLVR